MFPLIGCLRDVATMAQGVTVSTRNESLAFSMRLICLLRAWPAPALGLCRLRCAAQLLALRYFSHNQKSLLLVGKLAGQGGQQ
jgi:hypothetical protein